MNAVTVQNGFVGCAILAVGLLNESLLAVGIGFGLITLGSLIAHIEE